jgi:hypothetical protein
MTIFVLWVCCAVMIGIAATRHYGRNGLGWFLLSLAISPLLGGLFLICCGHKAALKKSQPVDWQRIDWNAKPNNVVTIATVKPMDPPSGPSAAVRTTVLALTGFVLALGIIGLLLAAAGHL